MTFLIRSCAGNVTNVRLDRNATLAEREGRERSSDPTAAHALIAASYYGGKHVGRPNSNWGKKAMAYTKGFPGGRLVFGLTPWSNQVPMFYDEDGWKYAWSLFKSSDGSYRG